MELAIGLMLGAMIGGVAASFVKPAIDSYGENELMVAAIRKRADRYVAAVAKKSVEDELEKDARTQATERLAASGILHPASHS